MIKEDFQFINVGSGSKGNASFILYKDTLIQIDMGLSLKSVQESLDKMNKRISDIDALLVTHDHSDHIKGIPYYRDAIKIITAEGTYYSCNHQFVKPFETIHIKDIEVTILKTSHDAKNPIGFLFKLGEKQLTYVTDSGIIPAKTLKLIKNCDYYVFESNHDVEMLENSGRPEFLILRILSNKGHLSNYQSANYLSKLIGDRTKKILLAHLSEDCNTPTKALDEHQNKYGNKGIIIDCLKQYKETIL